MGMLTWPSGPVQTCQSSYRTSVVAFPNGTFANVAHVEADAFYQSWMLQILRDALGDKDFGYISTDSSDQAAAQTGDEATGGLRWIVSSAQSALKNLRTGKQSIDASTSTEIADPETPIFSLIKTLKQNTENYLGSRITNVSMSFPVFFSQPQKLLLDAVLERASLQNSGCLGDGHSAGSAAIAHRRAQFSHPNSTTECTYGPFGVEQVINVEHTGAALTFHLFMLYVGGQSSWQEHEVYFVILRNSSSQSSPYDNATEEIKFWDKVQSHIRPLVSGNGYSRENVNRLVLTGTLAHDPHMLKVLQDTMGDLLPPDSPRAVRIVRSWEEIAREDSEFKKRSGLTCLLRDYTSEQLLELYKQNLLAPIDQTGPGTDIDPVFAAARGAALYSLKSRLVACERRCRGAECSDR